MLNRAVLIFGVAVVYLAIVTAVLASAYPGFSIQDFLKTIPISLFRPAILSQLALFDAGKVYKACEILHRRDASLFRILLDGFVTGAMDVLLLIPPVIGAWIVIHDIRIVLAVAGIWFCVSPFVLVRVLSLMNCSKYSA